MESSEGSASSFDESLSRSTIKKLRSSSLSLQQMQHISTSIEEPSLHLWHGQGAILFDKEPISRASLTFKFLEHLLRRNVSPGTMARFFYAVQTDFMRTKDIHSFISGLPDNATTRKLALRTYMILLSKLSCPLPSGPSALLTAARREKSSIIVAFGGQSSNNPACVDDLAELYSLYQPLVESLVVSLSSVLYRLSRHFDTKAFYLGREIDLSAWLANPSARPAKSFTAGAAVSFPIIGLTGLLHYCIICKMLGKTPAELGQFLSGITGHSQGIVIAAAVAKSHSWESFFAEARWAVELLFWMGYESQIAAPQSPLSSTTINDSAQSGDGVPSHMLLVRAMRQQQLEDLIAANNKYLPKHERLYLSLINSSRNHVVAGPPRSLRGLALRLGKISASDGPDQSRVPYSKREPAIAFQFLPVNSPFHSPYLHVAATRITARMSSSWPQTTTISSLHIPIFYTENGADMRKAYEPEADVTQLLIEAVTTKVVDWPKTLQVDRGNCPSHIVTLGAGRFSDMVYQNVDGYGVRVIDGARLDTADSTTIGAKAEIFASTLSSSHISPPSWGEQFKARLVRSSDGTYHVETRLNRILKAPPIMTAGMTPTTVPWDFVSAVLKAGYHIELAGGGYRSPEAMTAAIERVAANIPTGRSMTCNVIYADPKAIGFQIPLIRQLIRRGVHIEGLTIGAGVPSPDVAAEYILTVGIKHISFKPGSIGAIREVIEIARRHPTFPVILQWTGGRGGGHHSCEDFHEPLLETYSEIRRCENLYLVVGSGFGDGAGMFPYLTGSWSHQFGRAAMPCDGILLGSRMMVATDAHTSPGAKKLLLKAPGVDDLEWEKSYLQADAAGGVLTVISEMGQPIHKLATRGVRLWKEMDDTIFCLPKPERKSALLKRKHEIIRRLNEDFAKPWLGQNGAGQPVDVEDMTYAEVLFRLVRLMYVSHQSRWIDPSYRELVSEFAIQSLERLNSGAFDPSWLSKPEILVHKITETCPDIAVQLLHPEDVRFFVHACKTRGRKPVNFVVTLDDEFEHWFKKDSLWQSEDLDAVLDQDPERVCILQSPVSVQYATRDDQSSKEILDEIHGDLIALICGIEANNEHTRSLQVAAIPSGPFSESIIVNDMGSCIIFRPVPGQDLPSQEKWVECLDPYACVAILGLINEESLFEAASKRFRPNPFRRIFGPQHGYSLVLRHEFDEVLLRDDSTGQTIVRVEARSLKQLHVEFIHRDSVPSGTAALVLQWEYDEHARQLIDSTENRDRRIQDFYAHLWLGQKGASRTGRLQDHFFGDSFVFTQELQSSLHSVVSHAFPGASTVSQTTVLPLESAVIAAWDVLMRPLLIGDLQGDILRLVHQSISVEYVSNASPTQVGELVSSKSSVRSVAIEPWGKSIAVEAQLMREGHHLATITSKFFIKGRFSDYQTTFSHREEPPVELKVDSSIDEAVLRDRSWLQLEDPSMPLVGKTLVFQVHTHSQWENNLNVRGTIEQKLWNGSRRKLGSVAFDVSEAHGNPVMEFLHRKGKIIDGKIPLKNPGWAGKSEQAIVAPSHTHLYAQISGDCNPIHASPIFAELAELPGPITHGMYTAAVCRRVIEDLVIPGEPERLRRFDASFVGMVRPGDKLIVGLSHMAMKNGRMIFDVVARQEESGEDVLHSEAEVDQPSTAYLFTGQGSQSTGMGMALYETSPVAKAIYDEMDKHLRDLFGWSILTILRENPKDITVHFRGRQGQKVLENYLNMKTESITEDGLRRSAPIIPDLDGDSTFYTFSEARGLLHATQFAQPAIILLEKATLEHLRASGLIQEGAVFAGHSLGEYGALSSMAGFVDFKDMLSIGFYRGLMMQFAIPRDSDGQTGYAMMATNPSRVGKHFDDNALRALVRHIAQESGELLEIVNFNIEGDQYVCAGHVRNLNCLTAILDAAAEQTVQTESITEFLEASEPKVTTLGDTIAQHIAQSKDLPLNTELRRGRATIPLNGIDVPFHSARLRSGIPAFRKFLRKRVKPEDIRTERLVGSFIPNVVGKPFSLDGSFIQKVAKITQSPVLESLAC
ncbi:sterigmatocystin biosynthesis fatty acid synthase subunit beta [Xylariaceae sp. FL0662B]|nr:sterigmatocystin biosynthesis fatty acid synthase subunit beta [Xylariaceae sp. FL0662B]